MTFLTTYIQPTEFDQILGSPITSVRDYNTLRTESGSELRNIQPCVIAPYTDTLDASDWSQLTNTNVASTTACSSEESPSEGVLYPSQTEYGVNVPSSEMPWLTDANVIVIKPDPGMIDVHEETTMESGRRSLTATAGKRIIKILSSVDLVSSLV